MDRNSSHGRHGGNHNQQDEVKNRDPSAEAVRNTDVDSRAKGSGDARAGGHHYGDR